jgi:hypothetical protein
MLKMNEDASSYECCSIHQLMKMNEPIGLQAEHLFDRQYHHGL